ncbi:MAG: hypothetical protein HC820_08480, partial [Hydrococcus sp. RM1_1_31]|nr:hypothetical protein [Hydrococcus sp. RM1_1_31]
MLNKRTLPAQIPQEASVFNKFNPNFKKRLSQVLHSIAQKLETDSSPKAELSQESVSKDEPSVSENLSPLGKKSPPVAVSQESPQFLIETPTKSTSQPRPRRRRRRSPPLPPLSQRVKTLTQTIANRGPKFWLLWGAGVGFGGGAIVLGIGVLQLESSLPDSVEDVLTYTPPETITIQGA